MSNRAGEEEDHKPPTMAGTHITLKLHDTEGRKIYHKMRRTDKLQGLVDCYYAKVPTVDYGTARFLYDGARLKTLKTPAELHMEEGDEVDVFTELIGGGGSVASLYAPDVSRSGTSTGLHWEEADKKPMIKPGVHVAVTVQRTGKLPGMMDV